MSHLTVAHEPIALLEHHFGGEEEAEVEVEVEVEAGDVESALEAVSLWGEHCKSADADDGSLGGRDVCILTTDSESSLETMFQEEVTTIELNDAASFGLEGGAPAIRLHFPTKRGVEVSKEAGGSFLDLALYKSENEGLVVRDHQPSVKAYVDFNTLLLRIAIDRDDYIHLSTLPEDAAIDSPEYLERLEVIRAITTEATLPLHMKKYYLKHLPAFAKIYFRRSVGFKRVQDETLFQRLQKYAQSGNMIATVGDISDLRFLDQRTIIIPDHVILNI